LTDSDIEEIDPGDQGTSDAQDLRQGILLDFAIVGSLTGDLEHYISKQQIMKNVANI
jgi:hypothetical protein